MYYGSGIGRTKIALGVFDSGRQSQWEKRVPTPRDSYDAFLDAVREPVAKTDQRFGCKGSVGIGISGMPEAEDGTLYAANVPTASGRLLRTDLSARLNHDIHLDNGANCFVPSKARNDEFTQYPLVMGLIFDIGVGGGLIFSDKPITGKSYITGEFDHMRLPVNALIMMGLNFPLRRCSYGQHGCIENYLSGCGFTWLYQYYYHQPLQAPEIIALYNQGNEQAGAHVECYLDLLAVCLGNTLTIVDPDLVVIDSGLSSFPAVTTQLMDRLSRHLLLVACAPRIEHARYDDAGGMYGAALLHLTDQTTKVAMLSHRGHRLSRFCKNKRHLRERLRQRIFFKDKVVPEIMEKPRVSVLTGARVPAEPGIRTLHAADGLREEHRAEDMATPEGFNCDPEPVQAFYNAHRRQLQQPEIQPNTAYLALVKLQDALGDRFLLATQNIDNLHERADNTDMIHMHGELLKVCYSQNGQILDQTGDVAPEDKCHCCQFPTPLRPHTMWFGKMPFGMSEIYMTLSVVDILIAIGISGHVYPAAGFIHEARLHGMHTVELNLEPSQVGNEFAGEYYDPASQVVPEFVEKLLKGLKVGSTA